MEAARSKDETKDSTRKIRNNQKSRITIKDRLTPDNKNLHSFLWYVPEYIK